MNIKFYIKFLFIFPLLLVMSCSKRIYENQNFKSIESSAVNIDFTQDYIEIDTIFLIETYNKLIGFDFDSHYGRPKILIKPDYELNRKNYFEYKSQTIHFLYEYSDPYYIYEMDRRNLEIPDLANDIMKNAKVISLSKKKGYELYEKRMRLKCYRLGYEKDVIVDTKDGKAYDKKVLIYVIAEVENIE